jgi:two-component system chemotaxis sensor kinase CheA
MVMQVRMIEVEAVFLRFPRLVRDLSQKLDKHVQLTLTGGETELDRTVVDALGDPMVHLVRNSLDHGLEPPDERKAAGKDETGTLEISARHAGGNVVISVRDDGRGIDAQRVAKIAASKGLIPAETVESIDMPRAIELLFAPGFSTADEVSDISGRGVGMDVVKTRVAELGGTLQVHSRRGHGSELELTVPLTLAVLRVLMVRVEARLLALPLSNVEEVFELVDGQDRLLDGRLVAQHRGRALPLADLAGWAGASGAGRHVVVVHIGHQRLGCLVHEVLGREDVIVKPLGPLFADVSGIAGATVTGDGRLALVMDLAGLAGGAGQWLTSLQPAG